ncbi:MAG: polysaccharide deacetylase family protein [Sphingobacteriaceae bacterium]|nr:MAG: polysaccharide deacetylase family protein [Pedobacter sp.]
MYFVKSPLWLQYIYPSLIWHKDRKEKHVYLTFDDGPIPDITPFVLHTLRQFDAKATFFCVGNNLTQYPDIHQQEKHTNHAIGNHTYNHLNGWQTADDHYLADIKQCGQLISTNLFRPPHGKIKRSQIAKLKKMNPLLQVIMWDVLSYDFDQKISPQQCLDHVLKNTQNGSIIVFHDSLKAFGRLEYTLPQTLKHLTSEGYSFDALE